MRLSLILIALTATLGLTPCAAQKQHGKASFYSKRATGARSASGQKIHHDSLTCAHKFYPFGTRLKVTNMSNDKSVIVKVIDRGPYGKGRIIDLSWAAAKEIGMISQGVARVKVEMLENPIPFKPEDPKLPKLDFEFAETNEHFVGNWKLDKESESKDTPHNKPAGGKTTSHNKQAENKTTAQSKQQENKKPEHNKQLERKDEKEKKNK